mmetsp:Transcript_11093/g.24052  ORF Transcript_11093/g.24052 Transcript_11093/m.24052 type:complete len:530 (+) Transcript_11093:73-1662(+)
MGVGFGRKAKQPKVEGPQEATPDTNMLIGRHHRPAMIGTLAIVAISSIFLFATLRKKKKNPKDKRRLSFTSVGLGLGSFPPKSNVKEPIINAAVYFDDNNCPLAKDVAQMIIKPLLEYERLSHVPDLENRICRPSSHGGGTINPMDLIRILAIKGDEKLTNETILEHCQDCLGEGRGDLPWWEILIIRNSGSGPSACVVRIHHVIGDGLALVAAFDKILTNEDGAPLRSRAFRSSASSGLDNIIKKKKANMLSTIWSLVQATGHVLTLRATKYDDDTLFSKMNHSKMKHSGKREAVIFPTVPLGFVKNLKSAAGVTVNDILMTAVSQAIHDYCESRGDEVLAAKGNSIQCRGLLPVGFPRSEDVLNDKYAAMRNIWCMVSCDMGVGYSDIKDRLNHVHAKTMEMKEKPRAFMQLQVQNNLGPYIPVSVGQQTVFDTFSRHSLVLTNVPGPSNKVLFAGKKVKSVQLFFDNLLTQVDLISYAGEVYGNMVFDADQLPNSEVFGQLYLAALVKLAKSLDVKVPPEVGSTLL